MMDVKGKPASFKVKAAAMKGLKDLAGKKWTGGHPCLPAGINCPLSAGGKGTPAVPAAGLLLQDLPLPPGRPLLRWGGSQGPRSPARHLRRPGRVRLPSARWRAQMNDQEATQDQANDAAGADRVEAPIQPGESYSLDTLLALLDS